MIFDGTNPGSIVAEGKKFAIGQKVRGIEGSEFEGCRGTIFEIRDGKDRETENDTPDIYVDFLDAEYTEEEMNAIAEMYSYLYGHDMAFEDISLDYMICSPDEIEPDTDEAFGNAETAETFQKEQAASDRRALDLLSSLLNAQTA